MFGIFALQFGSGKHRHHNLCDLIVGVGFYVFVGAVAGVQYKHSLAQNLIERHPTVFVCNCFLAFRSRPISKEGVISLIPSENTSLWFGPAAYKTPMGRFSALISTSTQIGRWLGVTVRPNLAAPSTASSEFGAMRARILYCDMEYQKPLIDILNVKSDFAGAAV